MNILSFKREGRNNLEEITTFLKKINFIQYTYVIKQKIFYNWVNILSIGTIKTLFKSRNEGFVNS